MPINATLKNMKKYENKFGSNLIAVSPWSGEEYSATVGDYFWAEPSFSIKDSKGRVCKLAVQLYTKGGKRRVFLLPLER